MGKRRRQKNTEDVNKKELPKLYFGVSTNRLGNQKFFYEVTLENGKVIGWVDLDNRRTQRS